MPRILVVDDEPHIVDVIRAYLVREGHAVDVARDGDAALASARANNPDLLILDVMLPRRSGFEVLRELRATGAGAAVIMLTARDDVIDRVAGLELGADDYVTKPFEPRELVARVGAVLRRVGRPVTVATAEPFFDLRIDIGAREVTRDGSSVDLTRTEFDLLEALAADRGVVMTREQLGSAVFGEAFDASDRAVDSHVKNLRRKLGSRPDGGQYVETLRGVGYRAARP
ncbi:MAG TPA: response regulator transcription factor [Candidatus Limnocylindrales bacterium]|jgi:DNA-binding response OmpR family regulator